jgi:hypothetical protein
VSERLRSVVERLDIRPKEEESMLKQIHFVYGGGEGRVREERDRTGVRVAGRIGEIRMMHQRPAGEAMSREGKGTAAAGEAGKLDAEYGAPTSGGPPYDVYEITPTKAFGLPTDGESFTPTRWRFDR